MDKRASFLASSLAALFFSAHGALADCHYSSHGASSQTLLANRENPVLGKIISVIGQHDHKNTETIGRMIAVDCVYDDYLSEQESVLSMPYIHQLKDIAKMMEEEILQLRLRKMEPLDRMLVTAQCGLITVEFDPAFFDNDERSFTEALIHIKGIISSGNYDRYEHRGDYEFFAAEGDNLFSLHQALCIS